MLALASVSLGCGGVYVFMHKTIHIYTPIIESDSAPHALALPLMHIKWEGCHTTCTGWAQ